VVLEEARALWLVLRREYVERVKSTSFVASTFAAPALLLVLAVTPRLLTLPNLTRSKPIVIVCSAPEAARQITDAFRRSALSHYRTEIVRSATAQERRKLTAMVMNSSIDGFLWLDQAALVSGRIVYTSRSGLDALGRATLRSILYRAIIRARLAVRGLSSAAIDRSLEPVILESVALMNFDKQVR
jgi:ABC-type Na+ efflux pump permease subunit